MWARVLFYKQMLLPLRMDYCNIFLRDKDKSLLLQPVITFYCSSNAAPAERKKKAVVGDDAALRTTRSLACDTTKDFLQGASPAIFLDVTLDAWPRLFCRFLLFSPVARFKRSVRVRVGIVDCVQKVEQEKSFIQQLATNVSTPALSIWQTTPPTPFAVPY